MLIRSRLTLIFTLLATSIQVLLSVLAWYFYSIYRQQEFHERLEETALVAGRVLILRRHLHDDFFKNLVQTDLLTIVDEQISIWDSNKQLVFANRSLIDHAFYVQNIGKISKNAPFNFETGRLDGTGILFEDKTQAFYIFCAGYDRLGWSKLNSLQYILPLINLIGVSLIVLAGWYFSNKALSPITTIVSEVEEITFRHLNRRVNEGNRKDEIAQLAMTFNQMLFRLEKSFAAQRSFVSHASHELRTPLTNILGTLETSVGYDQDPDELRQSMLISIDEIKKVIDLTNSLLNLAKATDGDMVLRPVQVDDCLLFAVGQIQSKYPTRKLIIQFPTGEADDQSDHIGDNFTILGNASLLTTAFINILDNACKYSTDAITVNLLILLDALEIHVTDKGRGIEDQTHIFEPLYRGQNTEGVPGFGIGLTVIQKVVELHLGTLTLTSQINIGTTVVVRLPHKQSVLG